MFVYQDVFQAPEFFQSSCNTSFRSSNSFSSVLMDRTFSVAITSSFGLPLVVVFIGEDLVPRFVGLSFPRVPIDHSVGFFGIYEYVLPSQCGFRKA